MPASIFSETELARLASFPEEIPGDDLIRAFVRWFHSGGIFAALSESTAEVIIEGMKAARAAGAVVSFDLNFREKLWKISGGQDRAVSVVRRIMQNVDVLVGNEEDLQKGLGIPGPDFSKKSKLDPSVFFGMIERVTQEYPQVRIVATHSPRSALVKPPQLVCRGMDRRRDIHCSDL